MLKNLANKKIVAIMIIGVLAAAATTQVFAQSAQSSSADRIILRVVRDIQSMLTDTNFGLKEIKKEIRSIESNVTSSEFGLKEIKKEVRNIESNVTDPDFGLREIKREVRDIESDVNVIRDNVTTIDGKVNDILRGKNLAKHPIFKDVDVPVDIKDLTVVKIPSEQSGILEEASCFIKDAGAWNADPSAGDVDVIVTMNGVEICVITDATAPTSVHNDEIAGQQSLPINGGEEIKVTCSSSTVQDLFEGCSVEIDLWLKLKNN